MIAAAAPARQVQLADRLMGFQPVTRIQHSAPVTRPYGSVGPAGPAPRNLGWLGGPAPKARADEGEGRRAYADIGEAQGALAKVQGELIPLGERRRQQAEVAYKAGEADLLTLLLAEQDLQNARSKLVDLQKVYSLATFRLQRAAGGPGVVGTGGAANPPSAPPATAPAAAHSTQPWAHRRAMWTYLLSPGIGRTRSRGRCASRSGKGRRGHGPEESPGKRPPTPRGRPPKALRTNHAATTPRVPGAAPSERSPLLWVWLRLGLGHQR